MTEFIYLPKSIQIAIASLPAATLRLEAAKEHDPKKYRQAAELYLEIGRFQAANVCIAQAELLEWTSI